MGNRKGPQYRVRTPLGMLKVQDAATQAIAEFFGGSYQTVGRLERKWGLQPGTLYHRMHKEKLLPHGALTRRRADLKEGRRSRAWIHFHNPELEDDVERLAREIEHLELLGDLAGTDTNERELFRVLAGKSVDFTVPAQPLSALGKKKYKEPTAFKKKNPKVPGRTPSLKVTFAVGLVEEGYSIHEACQITGCNRNSVYIRLRKEEALNEMTLEPGWGEEFDS